MSRKVYLIFGLFTGILLLSSIIFIMSPVIDSSQTVNPTPLPDAIEQSLKVLPPPIPVSNLQFFKDQLKTGLKMAVVVFFVFAVILVIEGDEPELKSRVSKPLLLSGAIVGVGFILCNGWFSLDYILHLDEKGGERRILDQDYYEFSSEDDIVRDVHIIQWDDMGMNKLIFTIEMEELVFDWLGIEEIRISSNLSDESLRFTEHQGMTCYEKCRGHTEPKFLEYQFQESKYKSLRSTIELIVPVESSEKYWDIDLELYYHVAKKNGEPGLLAAGSVVSEARNTHLKILFRIN